MRVPDQPIFIHPVLGRAVFNLVLSFFLANAYLNFSLLVDLVMFNSRRPYTGTGKRTSESLYNELLNDLNEIEVRIVPLNALSISGEDEIGRGSRSIVYEATCSQLKEAKIAAKTIDVFGQDKRTRKHPNDLVYYIDIFNSITQHNNILHFIGVAFSSVEFYELTELCDTDLDKLSRSYCIAHNQSFPDETYQKILSDTCKGMNFLHQAGIMHRDLKADNILLKRIGNTWCAKVADFGLAKTVNSEKKVPRGPVKLNPPESLECRCQNCNHPNMVQVEGAFSNMQVSTSQHNRDFAYRTGTSQNQRCEHIYPFYLQSDVYMFGVMVYCVSHGTEFFGKLKPRVIIDKIKSGERPNISMHKVTSNFANLIAECWKQDYTQRPTFQELVHRI